MREKSSSRRYNVNNIIPTRKIAVINEKMAKDDDSCASLFLRDREPALTPLPPPFP